MKEVRLSSDISKNSPGTFNMTWVTSVLETNSMVTTEAVTVQWKWRDGDDVWCTRTLCSTKMSLSNDECTSDVKLRPLSSVNATVMFGLILPNERTLQLNTNVSPSDSRFSNIISEINNIFVVQQWQVSYPIYTARPDSTKLSRRIALGGVNITGNNFIKSTLVMYVVHKKEPTSY